MKITTNAFATVARLTEEQSPRGAMRRHAAKAMRPAKTMKVVLATIAFHAATTVAAFADTSITIGTPNTPSYNLAADLQNAYQNARQNGNTTNITININPGTYYTFTTQPTSIHQPAIVLSGWQNVTINGQGSTIRDENMTNNNDAGHPNGAFHNNIFELDQCNNVTIENMTITQDADWECQAHVVAVNPATASSNETLVVKWDDGYPGIKPATTFVKSDTETIFLDGADGRSRTVKQGSSDYYSYTVTNLNNGTYQIDFGTPTVPMVVGDIIWGRYEDPDRKFDLYQCGNCTIQNVTMTHNGFGMLYDDTQTALNHYFNITWAPGDPPPGATEPPVVGSASDGFHTINSGADIENCTFLGIIGDDEIAIDAPPFGFTVKGCTFSSGRAHGIYAYDASNGTIQGNKFNGMLQEDVLLTGDSTTTNQNVTVTGNTFVNPQGGGWPVCGTGPGTTSSNINVTNNLFQNCTNFQVILYGASGGSVTGNTFLSSFQLPGGNLNASEVGLLNCSGTTVARNLTQNRGPYAASALLNSGSSSNISGTANGIFSLDPLCGFVSQLDGQLISDPASRGAGTQLVTYTADGNANQNWSLAAAPSAPGYFTMSSSANGLVADVLPDPGSHPILLQSLSGSYAVPAMNQLWTMVPTDSTHVNLVNGQTLNDINIYGGSQTPNSVLVQFPGGNSANDNWLWQSEAYTSTGSSLSSLFSTGFESGQTLPTWSNTVYSKTGNITGVSGGTKPPPQCKVQTGGIAHTGTAALMVSGSAPSSNSPGTPTYCYCKSFSTSIRVGSTTQMSYWIYPQAENGEDNARFVAVDFICTDGSDLRDSGAVDANGFSMHPGAGHGATSGYDIPLNAWTQIKCSVGQWLAGKTIKTILVGYDESGATGPYLSYIDDLTITNVPLHTP